MASEYKILDEPEEDSELARFAVDPYWPLLAAMLGGSWIALPWFIFNSIAVGSASKKKEIVWAAASVVSSLVLAFIAFTLIVVLDVEPAFSPAGRAILGIGDRAFAYAVAGIIALKLYFAYRINWYQSKSYAIHDHYNGPGKSGLAVVIVASVARSYVMSAAGNVSIYALVAVL